MKPTGYLGRIFQIEGTQVQSPQAGMRLAYSRESKEASMAGSEWTGGGTEVTPSPLTKNWRLTVYFQLTTPLGGEWGGRVGVGGRDGKRRADSLIHKYLFIHYSSNNKKIGGWAMPHSLRDLSLLTRDQTQAPCSGSPNYWTAREVPTNIYWVLTM